MAPMFSGQYCYPISCDYCYRRASPATLAHFGLIALLQLL